MMSAHAIDPHVRRACRGRVRPGRLRRWRGRRGEARAVHRRGPTGAARRPTGERASSTGSWPGPRRARATTESCCDGSSRSSARGYEPACATTPSRSARASHRPATRLEIERIRRLYDQQAQFVRKLAAAARRGDSRAFRALSSSRRRSSRARGDSHAPTASRSAAARRATRPDASAAPRGERGGCDVATTTKGPAIAGPFGAAAVRMRGLEPPRACTHGDLNAARLPIPPHPLVPLNLSDAAGRGVDAPWYRRVAPRMRGRATLRYPSRRPAPLSSRGLGRRPLTAETGVRIPVAVSQRPC